MFKRHIVLTPTIIANSLGHFYSLVDDAESHGGPETDPARYYRAALQATNDRSSRVTRGEIVRKLINPKLEKE